MFDHYIGLDWSQTNMAVARMTRHSSESVVTDVRSDMKDLQIYLSTLKGKKILTFEESNPAQWLFTELKPFVDEILVCDPYRNHLLKEGGKNDKADAKKLVTLLKADLLKPVFHCNEEHIYLRKLVSGYDDLVKCGVRFKNQRSALFRGQGKSKKQKILDNDYENFVVGGLDEGINFYEQRKLLFEQQFRKSREKFKVIRQLESIPGIGLIGAVTILAIVVDPKRFKHRNNFFSYCGLIKHDLMSGGRSYGKRSPRYCRKLKGVFKTAALACLRGSENNKILNDYYVHLIEKKNYCEHDARHALARRIAALTLGVMKSNKKFNLEVINALSL